MRKYLLRVLVFGGLVLGSLGLRAQSLPVGTPVLEDAFRRAQLLGLVDSSYSFCARPFFPETTTKFKDKFDPFNDLDKNRFIGFDGLIKFDKDKGLIKLLPVTWINQYNSKHPEGLNDGAMIPSRGYQTMISGGLYAQYGALSIQLRPEIVSAENLDYEGFPHRTDPAVDAHLWYEMYYSNFNRIDLPERFGDKSYKRIFWGQSSIRLTNGPISLGISTENLWWGPGMRNALVMTNNAPGFVHFTLNTVKPIRTYIGSFEGQFIAGRLNNSGFFPPDTTLNYNGGPQFYQAKPTDWRYINGIVISYQPKWVPGLFLGATRTFQVYEKDMGKSLGDMNIGDIFPVFTTFDQGKYQDGVMAARKRDQLMSIFMRWVWLKANGEIYAEYGRKDYFWNIQDLEVEPSYSGAYILGFRKLMPFLSRKNEYIQINLELTQLAMSPTTTNRNGTSWYLSDIVKAGYTNDGQLLGAGIGPGSNSQSLNVSWVKGLKQIGLQLERFVHNNDYQHFPIGDIRNHWVDLSAMLHADWDYKNLVVSATSGFVNSLNYEWLFDAPPPPDFTWLKGTDVFNFHGQLNIMYRF